MNSLLLVAVGGVAGTLVRFSLSIAIPDDRNGTLAANLIGVALASALLVLMERRGITELRHLLLPGFCAVFELVQLLKSFQYQLPLFQICFCP